MSLRGFVWLCYLLLVALLVGLGVGRVVSSSADEPRERLCERYVCTDAR